MTGTQGVEASFLADIIANPADDVPRLIYADWLDEDGRPERAEFVRVQCELARMPNGAGQGVKNKAGWHIRRGGLLLRERELLAAHEYKWSLSTSKALVARGIAATFRRGFVASVELTAADWLAHGPALVRAAPLEQVRLLDVCFVVGVADGLFYPATDNVPWPWGHRGQPTQEEAEANLPRALIAWAKAQPAP